MKHRLTSLAAAAAVAFGFSGDLLPALNAADFTVFAAETVASGTVSQSISILSLLRCCSHLFYGLGKSHFASGDVIQSFWSSFFQKARGSRAEPSSLSAESETPPAFKSSRAWVPAIEAPIQNSIREADTSI